MHQANAGFLQFVCKVHERRKGVYVSILQKMQSALLYPPSTNWRVFTRIFSEIFRPQRERSYAFYD